MSDYELALSSVYSWGEEREDRTGTGTRGIFGMQSRYDLRHSFPLITSKRVYWKGVVEELLWMLRGETNVRFLQDKGVHIWDEWANKYGNLGPVYGAQWRAWRGRYDQITKVISDLKINPYSRRHIISAWNVGDLDDMALPPCHLLFQFYVSNDNKLSCQLYQRSADMFLGVPFNIASYALLTHIIAHYTRLEVGEFIHTIGDAHIYNNHLEQVQEQLSREERPFPTLVLKDMPDNFEDLTFDNFELIGYDPHPAIKGEVSV